MMRRYSPPAIAFQEMETMSISCACAACTMSVSHFGLNCLFLYPNQSMAWRYSLTSFAAEAGAIKSSVLAGLELDVGTVF